MSAYLFSLFQLLVVSAVGMGFISWLNGAMELEFYHGFYYLLDPWQPKPNHYPKYGPSFFYCLFLAVVAVWAGLRGNGALEAAAVTVWVLVLLPKMVNAGFIAKRMGTAAYHRFVLGDVDNPLLHLMAAMPRTTARDPFGPAIEVIKAHSWGVPTAAAIKLIIAHSGGKVVEACAGTGYWARMIWQHGGDVVAYDHSAGIRLRNNHHRFKPSWFPVRKGDGAQAAAKHSDRALLLCWPTDNQLSHEALAAYRGDTVIFVGANEGTVCVTGSADFHKALADGWHLVAEQGIPCWGELKDSVRVYKRGAQVAMA